MTPSDSVPANNPPPFEPVPDPTQPNTVPANSTNTVDPVPYPNLPITAPTNPPTENTYSRVSQIGRAD